GSQIVIGAAIFAEWSFLLLCRNEIKLSRRLFIKQRAFTLISTAPVLVPTRDTQEIAWTDALFAGIVFIQIGAFYSHNPDIVRVGMHTRIVPRRELRKRCMGTGLRISPDSCHRDATLAFRCLFEIRIIGGNKDDSFVTVLLSLQYSDRVDCKQ